MSARAAATWLLLLIALAGLQNALAQNTITARNVSVDTGDNTTLTCTDRSGKSENNLDESGRVQWIREGREHLNIDSRGHLKLFNVSRNDAGFYYCSLNGDDLRDKIYVQVRTTPPALQNVWVKPSTILANILWEVGDTGGYPIIDFTAEVRLKTPPGEKPEEWKSIVPNHIPPNARQIDVYHLLPNTTYTFRVWATNQLGRGEIVEVDSKTHHSDEELELARHLLAGVETFDTRVWLAAVGIVMGTLMVLGFGTCFLLYRECKAPYVFRRCFLQNSRVSRRFINVNI